MLKKLLIPTLIAFFSTGFFCGCHTYRNALPSSFDAVMKDPKFSKEEMLMFRFYLCDNDTFSLSINGVELCADFTPSDSSHYTCIDTHTTSGRTIFNYDYVLYQDFPNLAFIYLLNDQSSPVPIPMRNRLIEIEGVYSGTTFELSVSMGSCKQVILHHFHRDSIVVRDERLQGIRLYE